MAISSRPKLALGRAGAAEPEVAGPVCPAVHVELSIVFLAVGDDGGTVVIAHRPVRVGLIAELPLERGVWPLIFSEVAGAHLRLRRFAMARGVDNLAEK